MSDRRRLRAARMNTAADLVERSVSETPDIHWQKVRTNNPLERIMKEIRRRPRGRVPRWPVLPQPGRRAAALHRRHSTVSQVLQIGRVSALLGMDSFEHMAHLADLASPCIPPRFAALVTSGPAKLVRLSVQHRVQHFLHRSTNHLAEMVSDPGFIDRDDLAHRLLVTHRLPLPYSRRSRQS